MNMVTSLLLLSVFLIIYGMMIEVFTVLFQLTGITREKARTQVVSLLTNCGFTTTESEIMLETKHRRSLARVTMLFGYSFAVIIVSVLVNIFLTLNKAEAAHMLDSVIFISLFAVFYIIVMRMSRVRKSFDQLIEKMGNRVMFGRKSNVLILIDMVREKAMVEAVVDHVPLCLSNIKLSESSLKSEHNIQVLYIKRKGESLEVVDGDTVIEKGDFLLLFGDYKRIRSVFEHPDEE